MFGSGMARRRSALDWSVCITAAVRRLLGQKGGICPFYDSFAGGLHEDDEVGNTLRSGAEV